MPFLLTEQYAIGDELERVDLLQEVALATVGQVLGGSLPTPTGLADAMGGLAREGRLVGWAVDPAEEDLFERIGLSGALPDLDGGDGVAVVVNNVAPNKIDVYLERTLRYRAVVDELTGQATGVIEVTMTNTAPASGLPAVVSGNTVGEPSGTNHSLVTVYTALPVTPATLDGQPLPVESGNEQGWLISSAYVSTPAGSSTTIELQVAGSPDVSDGYVLSTRPQPLLAPEHHDIAVRSTDGDLLAVSDEVATTPRRIDAMAGD